ncbi:MAG TPA: hypothetical protein VHG28_08250 [Longimicrobiaceae bacterium]|nr:hypothetical protein [Longimicrobiaceae bacterium]
MIHTRKVLPLLLLALAACGGPPRPAEPAPPAPPPPPSFPYTVVWTREAATPVRVDSARTDTLRYLFTRLEVLESDSASLRVRCGVCTPQVVGWVEKRGVVYEPRPIPLAAQGELAEFLLAVRTATLRRDVEALRPVMSRQFTSSFGAGGEGVIETVARWQEERFRSLDRLPALLDRGVGTRDGRIWAAPPAYLTEPEYLDLRAGFRRTAGRWEWIFLVRGD